LRARYLRDVALADVLQLQRLNQRFGTDQRLLGHSVHRLSFECSLLNEKTRILVSRISAEGETYVRLVRRVKDLKGELRHEVAKYQNLRQRAQHLSALKLEQLRLDKSKLLTQGKVRALEEELETPMHVHRWRFLEGTNPELAQLLKMTQSLRGRFIVKIATLQRFQAVADELRLRVEILTRHLHDVSSTEHEAAVQFFEQLLRQKTKQLAELEQLIDGQKGDVEGRKSTVDLMRTQLNDTKGDYFSRKKQFDQLRAQSQAQRKSDAGPIIQSRLRFVGGGFAVAASADRALTNRPESLLALPRPPVVVPKVDTVAKLMPKGGNPTRKPLRPVLPTVSAAL
jgi:hypothetical protein